MKQMPLIIGHRGASAHAPENTLAAFRASLDGGADGIEFDVQLAKDGVPVVIHDATLRRTGLRPEGIAELTSKQLGKIDVGSWFNAKYPKRANVGFSRETVPTLAQVLELCRDFSGLIYIELKVNVPDYVPLATAVCDVIRDSHLLSQVIVKSFELGAYSNLRFSTCQSFGKSSASLVWVEINGSALRASSADKYSTDSPAFRCHL